jgi:UPF0755 protein
VARRRSRGGGRWRQIAALLAIAAAAALIAFLWTGREWRGAGPAERLLTVRIAEGSSLSAAARVLEREGAIRSRTHFLRLVRTYGTDDPIRAGEYEIPAHASAADILALLQSGRTRQHFVVVPEGMPSILVRDRLMAEPLLTGSVPVPAEASILPDSYSFERGESRAAVLARMRKAMDDTLAKLWKARKPSTVAKTPREALILASIVEKETAVPAERRTVAAVYSNRLRMGMRLQADPTVIYPITQGRPLGRRIRRSELDADNGYNTYARAGLPAGPIANPGRESIAAVLDPARTSALYFVADGKGGHVFADTLAEHNANVQRWYALRRQRGEM